MEDEIKCFNLQPAPNLLSYLQGREYGIKRKCQGLGPHQYDDVALHLAEEKATLPSKNQACELSGQSRSTFLMAFSPDGTKVASTHGDHSVRVTDLQSGRCTHILNGHPRTPWCLAYHPSSNDILASGCLAGQVHIWDLRGGGSEVWSSPKGAAITSMAFHPVDQVLVIATGNEMLFWDWSQPTPFAKCKTNFEYEKVRWVKFDPLGHHLYTGIANAVTVHRHEEEDEHVNMLDVPPHLDNDSRQRLQEQYRIVVEEATRQPTGLLSVDTNSLSTAPITQTSSYGNNPDDLSPQQRESLQDARAYANAVTLEAHLRTPSAPDIPGVHIPSTSVSNLSSPPLASVSSFPNTSTSILTSSASASSVSSTVASAAHTRSHSSSASSSASSAASMPPMLGHPYMGDVSQTAPTDGVVTQLWSRQLLGNTGQPTTGQTERSPEQPHRRAPQGQGRSRNVPYHRRRHIPATISAPGRSHALPFRYQQVNNVRPVVVVSATNEDSTRGASTSPSMEQTEAAAAPTVTPAAAAAPNPRPQLGSTMGFFSLGRSNTNTESTSAFRTVSRGAENNSSGSSGRSSSSQPQEPDDCPPNCEVCRDYPMLRAHRAHFHRRRLRDAMQRSSQSLRPVEQPQRLESIIESEVQSALDQVRAQRLDISETLRDLDSLQDNMDDTSPTTSPDRRRQTSITQFYGPSDNNPNRHRLQGISSMPSSASLESTDNSNFQSLPMPSSGSALGQFSSELDQRVQQLDRRVSEIQQRLQRRMQALQQERESRLHSVQGHLSHSRARQQESNARLRAYLDSLRDRYSTLTRMRQGLQDNVQSGDPDAIEASLDHTEEEVDTEPHADMDGAVWNSRVSQMRQLHEQIRTMRREMMQRRQLRRERSAALNLHRRHLHPHYAISILDETVNNSDEGLQAAINHAIAGAFVARGDAPVATNINNLTHRIQRWDFTRYQIPDITDGTRNVIVEECKLHNDASCDISADGRYLAVFIPSHRGFPDSSILGVYSLMPDETFRMCLYTKSFGPNAITVSMSPLNNYLLVGLASQRHVWTFRAKLMVAQVFRLVNPEAGEDSMEHVCDLMHPCDNELRASPVSLNSACWLPQPGHGLVYATNRGDLHICRPGYDEEKDKRTDGSPEERGAIRRNLMQFLSRTVPRTMSTATQTIQRVRRTASTQTDGLLEDDNMRL